jgi:hypothetical protein
MSMSSFRPITAQFNLTLLQTYEAYVNSRCPLSKFQLHVRMLNFMFKAAFRYNFGPACLGRYSYIVDIPITLP